MGLRTRLLVSSIVGLTLGDCVLTVDDVTRSSIIVAILCLTLCKIALPLRRAFTSYRTKHPPSFEHNSAVPDIKRPNTAQDDRRPAYATAAVTDASTPQTLHVQRHSTLLQYV